ncbi:hypothetical protein GCM10009800_40770 [Nocardiopsis rhodophaea]
MLNRFAAATKSTGGFDRSGVSVGLESRGRLDPRSPPDMDTQMPQRIQMTRRRTWRADHPDAVVVSRPTKWGNPFRIEDCGSREASVHQFRRHLQERRNPPPGWVDSVGYPSDEEIRAELAGHDLACWCPLPQKGEPDLCHAAILLRVAAGGDP